MKIYELGNFFETNKKFLKHGQKWKGSFDRILFYELIESIENKNETKIMIDIISLIKFQLILMNSNDKILHSNLTEALIHKSLKKDYDLYKAQEVLLSQFCWIDIPNLKLHMFNEEYDIVINNGLIPHYLSNREEIKIYIYENENFMNFRSYDIYQ